MSSAENVPQEKNIYKLNSSTTGRRRTITVREDIYQLLKAEGRFGESYGTLLKRLIEGYKDKE